MSEENRVVVLQIDLKALTDRINRGLQAIQQAVSAAIQTHLLPTVAEGIRWYRKKDALRSILNDIGSKRGWFVSAGFSMNQEEEIAELWKSGEVEKVDKMIADHVRSRVDEILELAQDDWKYRSRILGDAFQAHKEGKYTLSVPVLLIQADGMFAELTDNISLFGKQSIEARKRYINKHFEDESEHQGVPELLIKYWNIGIGLGLLQQEFTHDRRYGSVEEWTALLQTDPLLHDFNRNGVLHGIDFKYSSEENSLRCISMIEFMCHLKVVLKGSELDPATDEVGEGEITMN